MLTLITNGATYPLRCDDYYIRELPTGIDELQFTISIWDERYMDITEEAEIVEESDGKKGRYLVKGIDSGDSEATVKCLLDLDEWAQNVLIEYNSGAVTPAVLIGAIKPSGWSVVAASAITETETVEMPGGTPLDILAQCRDTFSGLSYRFDNINRIIEIWDLYNGPNLGAYTTRELNLKAIQYKGKSNRLVTRLYPYGRDGLSIAGVNSGLPYIDNNTYSSKIVSEYWQSDQFTDAQNLKDAAIEHLKEIAVPERAFSCDVVDLAATNPEKYGSLAFDMFSQVALIDETRANTKIMHRVSERWRYPMHPEKNKVILSNAPRRITVQVVEALKPITASRIAQGAVTRGKIGGGAVSTPKLADDSVTVNKIVNGAVVTEKIANDAVTTNKILNEAVSYAKMWDGFQVFWSEIVSAIAIFADYVSIDRSLECSVLYLRGGYMVVGASGSSDIYRPTHYVIHNNTYSFDDNFYVSNSWHSGYVNLNTGYYEYVTCSLAGSGWLNKGSETEADIWVMGKSAT